jgi:ribonuclease D
MQVITTTQELTEACETLARHDFITVDTEFMRESTFWPKLCLIQIASPADELIVDPLAHDIDLAPFYALMADETVVKVFHAARQDVEIVHVQAGIIPQPLFDTQVAAMVCGFGESISYSNLAKKIAGATIDKSSRFTDWARRPLANNQLTYALGDVTHLRDIYLHLKKDLEDSGRTHWLKEEMATLTDPATYEVAPAESWRRLKLRVKNRKGLAVLMELAAWRERAAQDQNVPRSRILRDEALYDIANQAPRDEAKLSALRTLSDGFARSRRGREILDVVRRGLDRDMATVPTLKTAPPIRPDASAVKDLLRVLLKACAAKHRVASKVIATSDDLERIAMEREPDLPALKGWRRELFGEQALALKAGRLALATSAGGVIALPINDDDTTVHNAAVSLLADRSADAQ